MRDKERNTQVFGEAFEVGMGENGSISTAPSLAPMSISIGVLGSREDPQQHRRNFDNSVNALSFGLVATAVLISMFLAMAIFERFLRSRSPPTGGRSSGDLESQMVSCGKLQYPSPRVSIYAREVSVLMPGEAAPTFIAQPAPAVYSH